MIKQCTRCRFWRSARDFSRSARAADGLNHLCRVCSRAAVARYKSTEAFKIKRRAYDEANRDKKAQYRRKWERDHRVERAAHGAVLRAVKKGKLARRACEVCGATPAQAHHESYVQQKRLAVRWLCSRHHRQHHAASAPVHGPQAAS